MSSDLTGIVALVMTLMRGVSKGKMGENMATGTVAVKTARITFLL